MKKIVVVGSLNRDTVLQVPRIPAPGETILCDQREYHNGGKGGNQAAAIARLGGNVSMIGCVGCDDAGHALLSSLAGAGVDTAKIERNPQADTGCAYICVGADGQNSIVVYPGANSQVRPEMLDQCREMLAEASYCVVQMEIPSITVEYLCKLCVGLGVKVLLNPAPARALDPKVFPLLEYIVPNETELQILAGEEGTYEMLAQKIFHMGAKHVIVTLGEMGCMLVDSDGTAYFPAQKVASVDTTAAGDAFVGGFMLGISEGMHISDSIRFATKAAAFSTTRKGAQPSLGTRDEIDAFFIE